jgi:hypothetical protein
MPGPSLDVVLSANLDPATCHGRGIAPDLRVLLAESEDLRRVWENPAIPAEQKRGLLDAIAQREGISKAVRNLVAVLIDHRRVQFLDAVIQQLEKELDARLGFAEAQITLASANWATREAGAGDAGRQADRQESARASSGRMRPCWAAP